MSSETSLVLRAMDLNVNVETRQGCNIQNISELLPYCVVTDSELHVEREWWEDDLLEETREKIGTSAANNGLVLKLCDALPSHGVKASTIGKPWTDLYRAVFEQYEYEKWGQHMKTVLPTIRTVEIPKKVQKELARLAKIKVLTGRNLNKDDLEDIIDDPFFATLSSALREVGEEVFVKMPTTSSKNEQKMRPVKGAWDCMEYITNTHCFAAELEFADTASLILLPWLYDLDRSHEYRVFVHRGSVTAISQQQWYMNHGKDVEEIRRDAEALVTCFENKLKALMPYKSGVLDMWVKKHHDTLSHVDEGVTEGDESMQDVGNLIEINPWGAGFSSGSSLFHWKTDFNILYGLAQDPGGIPPPIEVRYVGRAWEGGSQMELIDFMDGLRLDGDK